MAKAKTLVIVESPAKAKTIEKFLGKANYNVVASMGHVRDLPKSQFAVDIDNNFDVKYITIRGKGPLIADLKKQAKKASKVFLASDPDREGEAIAWHLQNKLELNEDEKCRISFNEITKEAVKDAVQHPRAIDMDLVDAQQARRVLDRIVGYKLSPLLWRKVKKGLSAGRVQSVALRLICEREDEIRKFEPVEYWTLESNFKENENHNFVAKLTKIDNKKADIPDETTMNNILSDLEGATYVVSSVKKIPRKKNQPLPFTTSTLQQDASRRLNFTARKTMRIAQQLYEGVSLGKAGSVGLITYMRTDSTRISDSAKQEAKEYIIDFFGNEYSNNGIAGKKTKEEKNVQDAHEAIRPTSVFRTPDDMKSYLSRDELRLYQLIWSRFVASQMAAAQLEQTTIQIEAKNYLFTTTGSVVVFDGFMAVYDDIKDDKKENKKFPKVVENESVQIVKHDPKQHFTQPPSRYNEASLIKIMEEKGIGRPSTYVSIIETIIGRNYVVRESKQFFPTEIGELVNDLLIAYFRDIIAVDFTANLEHELDEVENGGRYWKDVLEEFWRSFEPHLEKAEEEIGEIKIEDEITDIKCEKCGKPFAIKMGRYGKFLACTGFPECRNTRPLLEEIGVKCPKCDDGEVVKRRSKKGRVFYGCSSYPECEFVSWQKPTGEICPDCGDILLEKPSRNGVQIVCGNKECGFKKRGEQNNE